VRDDTVIHVQDNVVQDRRNDMTKDSANKEEVVEFFEGLEEDKVKTLGLDKIDLTQNEFEFRLSTRFNDLVESIKEDGQQFPVIVRVIPNTTPKMYQLVSGFRRVRALDKLGIPDVKAIVRVLDDDMAYKISFMENEKRKNLTGVDKAHAIAKLRCLGKTNTQIKELYGIGDKQLSRYEKVGKFPEILKRAISDGKIQTSHGLLLAQANEQHEGKVDLKDLVQQIAEGELTVRQLARLLNKTKLGRVAKKARYFEKQKGGGFRLYPMSFDPKTTNEATKAKFIAVLKEAVGVLEQKANDS
jgi:ParB/RepB/Spo0J family partition protein